MLRNYFKMAIKVLLRNKFYTFISMFGISFALAILLIVTAFWEHTTGSQPPEVNLDRSLVVAKMTLKGEKGGDYQSAFTGYHFLKTYVKKLKTPEDMTFFSLPYEISTFVEDKKVTVERKFTDASFWNVMKFNFIEGRGYTEEELKNMQSVAVISKSLKENFFGKDPAVGKEIEIATDTYIVIGVVEDVSVGRIFTVGDLYLPLSLDQGFLTDKSYLGRYVATLLAKSPAARAEVQREYAAMMEKVENPDLKNIKEIKLGVFGSYLSFEIGKDDFRLTSGYNNE